MRLKTEGVRRLSRKALSYLPYTRIIPPAQGHRSDGLSAMMTVKDEEEWIELSLRSVGSIADEIVMVDNGSTDRTTEIAARTIDRYRLPARLLSFPREDFCGAVNYTLQNTTRKWILRWHGDFIGHTSGPSTMRKMRERIEALSRTRYFCILLGPVSLDGDLFHQEPQSVIEREPLLFTHSPRIHYEQAGRFETLMIPWYYEKLDWTEPFFFHMRWVKPADRLLRRWFWTEWMSLPERSKWPTLADYVRHKTRVEWGFDELSDAARYLVNTRCRNFVRYDEGRFGPPPDLLNDKLRNPPFKIVYESGKILGRSDTLREPGRSSAEIPL